VELLTAPPSPSGNGDIDHELATVLGPLTLEDDVIAEAAWESLAGSATAMVATREITTNEKRDAAASQKRGVAQRFVCLSFRLLPPASWQLAIFGLLGSRRPARRLGSSLSMLRLRYPFLHVS